MHSIRKTDLLRHMRALATLLVMTALLVAPAAWAQKNFRTPDDAFKALVGAARAHDSKALESILGPGGKKILPSGDPVADRNALDRFAKAYDEANKIETAGEEKATLTVGNDAWPFPIPVIKTAGGWHFDPKQGQEELLNRRIGRNELTVIQVVQAYVDAQREYYTRNPENDKLLHYAQKFVSTKGKRDGLYYPTPDGQPPSPLGVLFARGQAEGYKPGTAAKPNPYYGYYYRILKGQGPNAKGGAYDYVAKGKMIGGFALVAYPAEYRKTGVMTFIVDHDGVVFQKDLGPKTAAIAGKMTKFDPDATWKRL